MKLGSEPPPPRLIALTPLIDVVFILLVFFMLASSFLDWRAVDLRLTAGAGETSSESEVLLVRLLADGSVSLNGAGLTESELEEQVLAAVAEDGDLPLIVRPEAGVELQRAVSLLDLLRRAGVTNVSLSRDPQ